MRVSISRKRAEALRVVAAAPAEPVAGGRLGNRVVGDGAEVVERRWPVHGGARRVRRERHEAEAAGRHLHRCEQLRVRGQRLFAGDDVVFVEHERDQRRVGLDGQRAGIRRRHRGARDVEQRAHGLAAVLAHERVALERRAERTVVEVGAVADGAGLVVGGAARGGLLCGERERDFLRRRSSSRERAERGTDVDETLGHGIPRDGRSRAHCNDCPRPQRVAHLYGTEQKPRSARFKLR